MVTFGVCWPGGNALTDYRDRMLALSRSERTRQALQQAAMRRFVADGVHQTSVADIAADVGVTERTFYRHFPSKHAVIFADYDIGFEWFARALALRPHGEPITQSVRKAVDAFPFDFQMVREAATIRSRDLDQDIITSHIRRLRDQLADEIQRFIRQRSAISADGAMIADIAAHSLATAVFAALEAWMNNSEHDCEKGVDELSRLTDTALRALEEGLTYTLRHVGLD
jgi:AcrR family transcriptional regulator